MVKEKKKSLFTIINDKVEKGIFSFLKYKREKAFKQEEKEKKAIDVKKDFSKKKKKPSKPTRQNVFILKEYLMKAGYEFVDERKFSYTVKKSAIITSVVFIVSLIVILFFMNLYTWRTIFFVVIAWIVVFSVLIGLFWMCIYLFLDFKIYNRTKQVEDVLPDFLQLTSANISAGMPIDQALWFAVRPQFGVLAKEIEEVAKSMIAGQDLGDALKQFSKKYDSLILKRTVNLIIEGMNAGGEMAELLARIAIDIQETKLMKKEIAASVMTYVIFISFATIAAAPFLFALSTQLLAVVQGIMSGLDLSQVSSGAFNISVSGDSINMKDFKIFSVLALSVSAFFSAAIVSTIMNGNIKDGMKYIPIFLVVSLILYFIANNLVGGMMSAFI